jgi:hypothetical protein
LLFGLCKNVAMAKLDSDDLDAIKGIIQVATEQ